MTSGPPTQVAPVRGGIEAKIVFPVSSDAVMGVDDASGGNGDDPAAMAAALGGWSQALPGGRGALRWVAAGPAHS